MQQHIRDNLRITEDSNVIIALGDSFVQGVGAYPSATWDSLDWDLDKQTNELNYGSSRYFELTDLMAENCFLNVLTRDYLKDYTPINFGFSGNGNRGCVKALTTLHPDLNITAAKKKIVIYYVGQFCRFDFFNKYGIQSHNYIMTVWPHEPDRDQPLGIQELWRGYATEVHTDKTELLEFISNAVELQTWCKAYDAELVYVNSFEPRFNKDYMTEILGRTNEFGDDFMLRGLVDMIEWDKVMPIPGGHNSMVDLLIEKENMSESLNFDHAFYGWSIDYCKKHKSFTPEGYFTPCAHPSVKAHKLIAKIIYEYLKNGK